MSSTMVLILKHVIGDEEVLTVIVTGASFVIDMGN